MLEEDETLQQTMNVSDAFKHLRNQTRKELSMDQVRMLDRSYSNDDKHVNAMSYWRFVSDVQRVTDYNEVQVAVTKSSDLLDYNELEAILRFVYRDNLIYKVKLSGGATLYISSNDQGLPASGVVVTNKKNLISVVDTENGTIKTVTSLKMALKQTHVYFNQGGFLDGPALIQLIETVVTNNRDDANATVWAMTATVCMLIGMLGDTGAKTAKTYIVGSPILQVFLVIVCSYIAYKILRGIWKYLTT